MKKHVRPKCIAHSFNLITYKRASREKVKPSREEQLRDTMVRKSWRSEERRNHAWKATSGVSALFWRAAYAR